MIAAEQVLDLLKDAPAPLLFKDIKAQLPDIISSTLESAVRRLSDIGCIAPTHGGKCRTTAWRYVAPWPLPVRTEPNQRTTPAQREHVYRACQGATLDELIAITRLDKAIVRQSLHYLAQGRRIRCEKPGRRWVQADCIPSLTAPKKRGPGKKITITEEDKAWQRYWHPENRENRWREHHA